MLKDKFKEPIKVEQLGFVRLVDTMGDDAAIAQAARVSYGAGTKSISDDRALLRYLMRHKHTSPFEMCEIKLHIKAPIHVMRQWIRHRTANVNEVSTRYSEVKDEFELIDFHDIRMQSKNNKQGSSGLLINIDEDEAITAGTNYNNTIQDAYCCYKSLIDTGVAREQARNVLPLATYTECYWKIDLHNLFHFLNLRLHPHAQQEIREFANAIYQIVKEWCPVATEAFEDYQLYGCHFSKQEMDLLVSLLGVNIQYDTINIERYGLSKREFTEFKEKIGIK